MEPTRVQVDEANQQRWIAVAHSARIHERMLSRIGDPAPGSNFAQVADLFPFEKVADRARAYLRAGLDHLMLWADYAVPLKFHEEQVINFTFRPTFTLARAAIEASAQAVWLMDTREPEECIRRHLSLMRWDLNEHYKSKEGDPAEQAAIELRRRELLSRVSAVFQPDEIKPPRGYLEVIRDACAPSSLDLDADTVERLWRAASGAAHGKYWTNRDLQIDSDVEGRTITTPDPSAMSEVLEAAHLISQYGVLRFADYAGADIQATLDEAVVWVAQNIPMREGASREEMLRVSALIARRSSGASEPPTRWSD